MLAKTEHNPNQVGENRDEDKVTQDRDHQRCKALARCLENRSRHDPRRDKRIKKTHGREECSDFRRQVSTVRRIGEDDGYLACKDKRDRTDNEGDGNPEGDREGMGGTDLCELPCAVGSPGHRDDRGADCNKRE